VVGCVWCFAVFKIFITFVPAGARAAEAGRARDASLRPRTDGTVRREPRDARLPTLGTTARRVFPAPTTRSTKQWVGGGVVVDRFGDGIGAAVPTSQQGAAVRLRVRVV